MLVVLIDHFNMKKGINIFCDRADTALMKDINNIHDMKNYKLMDASTLT